MRLFRYPHQFLLEYNGDWYQAPHTSWDELINRSQLRHYLVEQYRSWPKLAQNPAGHPLAPIGQQEVWASGVTYLRSKMARMEEAKDAGGGDFYDRVYQAERPELFFKATAARVVGPEGQLHIRRDSEWDVPEPELTLFVCSAGTIEAYTIGNDMSSRSIEGENPLYLPQAKTYDNSAGLGPCLYIPERALSPDTRIELRIFRNGDKVFQEHIQLNRMKRDIHQLAQYLYRECSFPHGCFIMSGTGIVPPDDFTLATGDMVEIDIQYIGTLRHTITQRQN